MVLSVTMGALFEGADDKPILQRVKIAKDLGIRDMAAVAGGFLVVAGPMGDEGGAFPLYLWDGGDRVEPLGKFTDLPEKARVEGLLVVEETDRAYSVIVTYDGVRVEGSLPGFEIRKPH